MNAATKAATQKTEGALAGAFGNEGDAAADVAYQLADCHEQQRDAEQAAGAYSEALKHNDAHEKAILALARLQLSRGELEAAQERAQLSVARRALLGAMPSSRASLARRPHPREMTTREMMTTAKTTLSSTPRRRPRP